MAELKKCAGVFMPEGRPGDRDGGVGSVLGRQRRGRTGVDFTSGEKWGRGPAHDVHTRASRAQVDSPYLASGTGVEHAGRKGWPHACRGGILRQGQAADCGAGANDRGITAAKTAESDREAGAGCAALDMHDKNWVDLRSILLESQADHQHRGIGGRLHQDRAARPMLPRTRLWRRSTCVWCRT